ncbi:hypothetical protein EJB05_00431, partial [Eragrostis curvula]
MDHHRCRRVATLVATALWLVVVHEGRCGAAARPLRRLHAAEEMTAPAAASEAATFDVAAAAEAPEGARWGVGGDEALNAGKWLPMPMMPMSLTFPAASALRFPPVSLFPGAAGVSMPWLPGAPPAFAGPGGGLPAGLVPPYIGATRQEQLSLWASLFNPMQVRPRLPATTLGGGGAGETTGGQVDRGAPAIASGGKAVEEGETMDVPAAGVVPLGEPKWGVFLGNIDHRH